MLIEAHRGDRQNAPENTMAAFRRALALSVPWIELDVRPTAEGTLVVMHDETVDRTTNGSGFVGEMTVGELLRLDAGIRFDTPFAGERIPLLGQVLELAGPTPTRLNIEIKNCRCIGHVASSVVKHLRKSGKEREYVVSSFEIEALLQVQEEAPEVALALIGSGPEILPAAQRHGLAWVHGRRDVVDEKFIADAHGKGMRVNVWTVDEPAHVAYWSELGADKLCTNRPAAMLAAAAEG